MREKVKEITSRDRSVHVCEFLNFSFFNGLNNTFLVFVSYNDAYMKDGSFTKYDFITESHALESNKTFH